MGRAPGTRRQAAVSGWAVLLFGIVAAFPAQGGEGTESLRTRYPIVLSHHWSGSADRSFLGDEWDGRAFNAWGIVDVLRDHGAVVYLPDKVPFASHEDRGRLLYRRCEGDTLAEKLCMDDDAVTVDGVEWILMDYCSNPELRHPDYADFADCIERVQINIICHSQGCPDSRYMIAAVTNRLSGRPMHEHVASWSSLAGANKGTALADRLLAVKGERPPPGGREVPLLLRLLGYGSEGTLTPEVYDSVVALTRKYMTQTTDMDCNPRREDCPPSFNQLYPNHPDIYYQSFSGRIEWLHACYRSLLPLWAMLWAFEGPNDGHISVESQRFVTAGDSPDDPPTFVEDRGLVTGESDRWLVPHPGISHMGLSTSRVPGMGGAEAACTRSGRDAVVYRFSREQFFIDLVAELRDMGF